MDLVREKIKLFIKKHYELELVNFTVEESKQHLLKFLVDRRNASFGDSLINFIYSCSKTLARNECTGIKISDEILLKGFNASNLNLWLKLPGKKKDQANALEALIFYIWLNFDYSIEEMALNVLSKLNTNGINLNDEVEEKRLAGLGLANLFNSFNELLTKQNKEKGEKY